MRLRARRFPFHFVLRRNFSVGRELVQHVRQRFRVHQPVLDRHFQHLRQQRVPSDGCASARAIALVQLFAQPVRCSDRFLRGPASPTGLSVGKPPPIGSMPNANSLSKVFVERSHSEGPFCQQVPVKRLDVADVENDAMAFGNRPVIHGLFPNDLERPHRCGCELQSGGCAGRDGCGQRCQELPYSNLPPLGCRFRLKDARKFSAGRKSEYDGPPATWSCQSK